MVVTAIKKTYINFNFCLTVSIFQDLYCTMFWHTCSLKSKVIIANVIKLKGDHFSLKTQNFSALGRINLDEVVGSLGS